MSKIPAVLRVENVDPNRWSAPNPTTDPEGRDIVFSGQLLAQMIMTADAVTSDEKQVKSIHAVFARAGRYSAGQVELIVEPMHSGRAWASQTITAVQGDRLLSRGLVLLNETEPDLMRHAPVMPDVPGPDDCRPLTTGVVFAEAEARIVDNPGATAADGSPVICVWVRCDASYDSVAARQALIAWSQPGFVIGAAFQAHRDTIDIKGAHRTISTGVISHTAHFHDVADVGDWLLFVHEGTFAGNGRVFGKGAVFDRAGTLVSTFGQDSMARHVGRELDFKSGM